jgi:hypothetical protein
MANTIKIPRAHLVMALCLPLATLLGYFLAEPMDSGSVAVVVLVLAVLAVPLLMKWYHPMLVVSWNLYIIPAFLPGRPLAWMMMAPIALLFALLNRSVSPDHRFISNPSVTKSLVFLTVVVLVTAQLTGGIGFHAFGANTFGGKYYFYILAAVAGYFAFTSQRIPPNRAGLYVVLFFLPGLVSLVPNLTYILGPGFYFLFNLFPASLAEDQANAVSLVSVGVVRIGGLQNASLALAAFLLARYGIQPILVPDRPWRTFFLLVAALGGLACGYRSTFILLALTFGFLFYLEGLHRTRLLALFVALGLVGGALLVPFADKLPWSVQRTVSFLPIGIDPVVKQIAQASSGWRVQIWKEVLPQVPKYFFKGKGYSLNSQDLEMAANFQFRDNEGSAYGAIISGDYHSGPLSVIIPFGIFGVVGFLWFLAASMRVLYRNYKFGDAGLRRINACLLCLFAARALVFIFIFGSFYSDLCVFTGLIGLSASLNGRPEPEVAQEPIEESLQAFETIS